MITSLSIFFYFELWINLSVDRLTSHMCGFKIIQKQWIFSLSDNFIGVSLFSNIFRQLESQTEKMPSRILCYDTMSLMKSEARNKKNYFLKKICRKRGISTLHEILLTLQTCLQYYIECYRKTSYNGSDSDRSLELQLVSLKVSIYFGLNFYKVIIVLKCF